MATAQQRKLLFWLVCIPTRTWITLRARDGGRVWLRLFAAALGLRWLAGLEVGKEGVFGGPAFWADERPLHGALWFLYAVSDDWRYLGADTALGALNWLKG